MAWLNQIGGDPDFEVECSECEAVYTIYWHRNPAINRVEYCPFCGCEHDEDLRQKNQEITYGS